MDLFTDLDSIMSEYFRKKRILQGIRYFGHNRPRQNRSYRLQYSPFEYPVLPGTQLHCGWPSAPGSPTVNVREHIPRKGGFPYA
jgi:hypothetical protein